MTNQNEFNDFDEFDLASGLYFWLQHNWQGHNDALYEAFGELTSPGMYRPSRSQENFEDIDSTAYEVYELLDRSNYRDALNRVLNYGSSDS